MQSSDDRPIHIEFAMAKNWRNFAGIAVVSLLYVVGLATNKVNFPLNQELQSNGDKELSSPTSLRRDDESDLTPNRSNDSLNPSSAESIVSDAILGTQTGGSSTTGSTQENGAANTSPPGTNSPGTAGTGVDSSKTNAKLSCQIYVNPIGLPASSSYRLIVTSKTDFTAKVLVLWKNRTESLTLDVVKGSASSIIKGDQPVKPEVSISTVSDTSTEICVYRNS